MQNMRRLILILCAAVLAAVTVPEARAQRVQANRDDLRGSYITNKWSDNWTFGVSGGINLPFGDNITTQVAPNVEVYVTKWFTPEVGARIGWQGISLKEWHPYTIWYHWQYEHHPDPLNSGDVPYDEETGKYDLSFGLFYIHGDLFWNVVTTIDGFKRNRFWDLAPYVHTGYLQLYDNITEAGGFGKERKDNELNIGFGFYNTFRITERIIATLDTRLSTISGRYHDDSGGRVYIFSASAGLGYNINLTYWRRSRTLVADREEAMAAYQEAIRMRKAAESSNSELEAQIQALENRIKELTEGNPQQVQAQTDPDQVQTEDARPEEMMLVSYEVLRDRAEKADLVIYYLINVDEMNFSERRHLAVFTKETLAADPGHVFYLTGSADKGTGSTSINTRLSRARAEKVKKVMVEELGVPENQVIIKATIIADTHEDAGFDRSVLIESR